MTFDPALKHALAGAMLISLSGAPLGVMLVLRRMSLMGDVIAHAILPGTAAGFILAGTSMAAMSAGGMIAGVLVALLASVATRFTSVREDANLATFYLFAVALGILMLAMHGTAQDLEDILFGDAESIDAQLLTGMGVVASLTLAVLAVIYRPLVVESFDPVFMRAMRGRGGLYHGLFTFMVVINMVAGYRALGTLMASGLLLIPGVTAQFWTRSLSAMMGLAVLLAMLASAGGVLIAAFLHVPSGPAIVLTAGFLYLVSVFIGKYGSVGARYFPSRHLES